MIVLAALVAVVVSVPIFGGTLMNVGEIAIRRTWLILLGFAAQTMVISVAPRALEPIADGVHIASYVLAAAFLLSNLHVPGVWIIGLGGALNFAAIVANGGTMPAGAWATRVAGMSVPDGEFANSALVDDPNLLVFGDILPIPEAWPLSNVFSIGDVLLVVGAAVVLHRVSGSRLASRPAREPGAGIEPATT